MKPECTETRTMLSGKRKGESFTVAHCHMKSLEEYGFQKYESYSERETNMYKPAKKWDLLIPGKKRLRRTHVL